jgi:hypothetical protein
VFGVSNPPKSALSDVVAPLAIFEITVVAKLRLRPKVLLSPTFAPAVGNPAVVPNACEILPILISLPVAGICPIVFNYLPYKYFILYFINKVKNEVLIYRILKINRF